jgi:hypothetical protein
VIEHPENISSVNPGGNSLTIVEPYDTFCNFQAFQKIVRNEGDILTAGNAEAELPL